MGDSNALNRSQMIGRKQKEQEENSRKRTKWADRNSLQLPKMKLEIFPDREPDRASLHI